jgi:hypothetical protein
MFLNIVFYFGLSLEQYVSVYVPTERSAGVERVCSHSASSEMAVCLNF